MRMSLLYFCGVWQNYVLFDKTGQLLMQLSVETTQWSRGKKNSIDFQDLNFPDPEARRCHVVQTDASSAEMLKPWNIQVVEVPALDLVLCTTSSLLIIWFLFSSFFFLLRIIALQCCVGLRHTIRGVSHNYTFLLPLPLPSHPARSSPRARLCSLRYMAASQ